MPPTSRGTLALTSVAGLALLVVAAWSVWVIWSASALRAQVEHNVAMLGGVARLRATADGATGQPAADPAPLAAQLRATLPDHADAIAELERALAALAGARTAADERALRGAADEITAALRRRNRDVSIALGQRWTRLNGVAVVVVLFAAAVLGLLVVAQRRRAIVEANQRELQARHRAVREAAERWAAGDLSHPVEPRGAARDEFEDALESLRQALEGHVATLEQRNRENHQLAADLQAQLMRKTAELAAAAADADARTRVLAGRYQLLDKLGEGGMGTVHRARRVGDGRIVAVKLLQRADDERARTRFLREARLLADIQHPNVVRILDVDVDDGRPFLVTEIVEGDNLLRPATRTLAEQIAILRQVAAGLQAIHARGIIHRDLKLSNIVVTSAESADGGAVKIIDLGIALDVGAPRDSLRTPDPASLTDDGVMLGTLRYIPPEAGRATALTEAVDIFSFGVVATALLKDRFPWRVPPIQLVERLGHLPPPQLAGLPAPLAALIARCLAERPEDRPSAAELVSALSTTGEAAAASSS